MGAITMETIDAKLAKLSEDLTVSMDKKIAPLQADINGIQIQLASLLKLLNMEDKVSVHQRERKVSLTDDGKIDSATSIRRHDKNSFEHNNDIPKEIMKEFGTKHQHESFIGLPKKKTSVFQIDSEDDDSIHEDLLKAFDKAIHDGVDILSVSIGIQIHQAPIQQLFVKLQNCQPGANSVKDYVSEFYNLVASQGAYSEVITIVVYNLLICSSKNQRDILMTCMATKKLNQLKHPIDSFPFEVLCDGAWWFVECMKVKDGAITTCFEHMGLRAEEIVPLAHLRMRSRKATVADCIRFLRPGVDICVHSTYPCGINSSEESPQAAWVDAKICSIERKPHEFRCSCRFYRSFNGANKEVHEVKLDDITILQKLDKKHCEDEFYRWSSSTDCASTFEAKLRGKFSCDISWMLAASCVKGLEFKVRSVQNKMFYQVVGGYQHKCRFGTDKSTKAINFKTDENGVMKPFLTPFVTEVSVLDEKIVTGSFVNLVEDELHNLLPCDLMELRRSKRRYVQPDRFVAGEGGFMERKKKKKDVERSSPIWCEANYECLDHMLEHKNQVEYSAHGSKDCTNGEFKAPSEFLWRMCIDCLIVAL